METRSSSLTHKGPGREAVYLTEPGTQACWHQGRKAFHLPAMSCCLLLTPEEPKKNVRFVTVLGKDLFWVTVRHFMVLFENWSHGKRVT